MYFLCVRVGLHTRGQRTVCRVCSFLPLCGSEGLLQQVRLSSRAFIKGPPCWPLSNCILFILQFAVTVCSSSAKFPFFLSLLGADAIQDYKEEMYADYTLTLIFFCLF